MRRTVIRSTGRYLPERIVTNEDLTDMMDTSDEWIVQRTGIKQRHWVPDEGVATSDLALEASKIALKRAGWNSEDLDLIVFATLSPDMHMPGAGCILQHKLGTKPIPALDIRQQCTGFIHGLEIAHAYSMGGLAKKILVVGAEVQSKIFDLTTRGRDMAVIFADGAGVACVESVDNDKNIGLLSSVLHANGEFAENLMIEAPASRLKKYALCEQWIQELRHFPSMDGRAVFKFAINKLPEVAREALNKAGMTLDEIDLIIPHQANLRINQALEKKLELAPGKIFNNIERYGNTTAGTIPIALDEAIEMGKVDTTKDTIMFIGLGAGYTWGASIYRFG
ncbi:MAG: ketoacyl-ACP synthase III [Desulfobacterales bacterium]|nr:ketoacyl-ACP synthase III [Desulfobacterales bacterium]